MEPIPAEELKAEKFPRISAEDLIELCELSGPSKAPNPAKSSKSSKPLIVVIDVRSEDEYPFTQHYLLTQFHVKHKIFVSVLVVCSLESRLRYTHDPRLQAHRISDCFG